MQYLVLLIQYLYNKYIKEYIFLSYDIRQDQWREYAFSCKVMKDHKPFWVFKGIYP